MVQPSPPRFLPQNPPAISFPKYEKAANFQRGEKRRSQCVHTPPPRPHQESNLEVLKVVPLPQQLARRAQGSHAVLGARTNTQLWALCRLPVYK